MGFNITGYSDAFDDLNHRFNKLSDIPTKLASEFSLASHATYTSIMTQFYSTYKPRVYKRIPNLYKIGRPFLSGTTGGLSVSPAHAKMVYKIRKNKKNITTTEVMDLMWNQGVRGLPPGFIGSLDFNLSINTIFGTMSGTPDNVMTQYVESYLKKAAPQLSEDYINNIMGV